MKDTMTSFDLAATVLELAQVIKGARIDNIYQISPQTILLSLRGPSQNLIVEAGKRIHLTAYQIERPPFPSPFCRALRKHIRGGIIDGIQQQEFERVIIIEISAKGVIYKLISEIFGRGNIILIDHENKILHALTYRRMRDRNIVRDESLQPPPPSGLNPLKTTRQHLEPLKDQKVEIVRALTDLLSIGGLYAEEVLRKAGVDKKTSCDVLTDHEIDKIHSALIHLTSNLTAGEILPHIVVNGEGKWVDILPFPLSAYDGFTTKRYATFNEAADDYFTKLATKMRTGADFEKVDQQVQKQERILNQQETRLEGLQKSMEENQRVGDIIYTHLNELQKLVRTIIDERRSGNEWNQIVSSLREKKAKAEIPASFLESIDPKRGLITVMIDGVSFKLSLRQTVQRNASRFYDRAKRAKGKIEGLEKAIAETREKLKIVQQQRTEAKKRAPKPSKIREKAWYEKFHWSFSSEGPLIIGGRDAGTNELLVKRYTDPNDVVLHADVAGAPFVLVKADRKVSKQTILEAAQMSASYSRAWRSGLSAIDVYWVKAEQVSKKAPSGEYVSRGTFMIRGPRDYIRNVPLRISIGIKREDDQLRVIGGPPSAITSQTKICVEIMPGRQTSGALAKKIRFKLAEKAPKELHERIRKLPIEEIQRFIPAGRGEIVIS